ncbi:CU044_5270 family protein [Kitasatospora sp. NPDC002040]|uniref:CU044_5270 family protein n=1 Tax=Kitasatospora sp. NPDC002040 TaxID=3154661 RepID=UPI003321C731
MNREHEPVLPADRHQLLRGHLMSEISRENTVAENTAARKRPVRRYGWVALPALAGGLALTVLLNTGGGAAPAAAVTVGQVLDRAAAAAAARSLPQPDGKYVYVDSLVAFGSENLATGETTPGTLHRREAWQAVDGTKPGLVKEEGWQAPTKTKPGDPYPANPDGSRPTEPNTTPSVHSPTYQFLEGLPTDPEVLLGRLYDAPSGDKQLPVDQRAFETVGDLLTDQLAPPAVTAALYRAAARIPGVELLDDSVDASGRHGWGVARTADGVRTELVFDRGSYEFLGERSVEVGSGAVVGQSAMLTKALVDRVGER